MLKTLKILLISIYAVCGGVLVLFAIPQLGWKALDVGSGSMTPAIPQGSLVLDHRVAPSTLKVGNVITYINPNNPKETITHRIITVTTKLGLPAFVTKGDANQVADAEILGGNVVGKVEWHLPYIGKVIGWAKQPLGLAILVIIPGILIIIDELRRLIKTLSSPLEGASSSATDSPNPNAGHSSKPQPLPKLVAAAVHDTAPRRPRSATIDLRRAEDKTRIGLKHLVILVAVTVLTIGATRAALTTQATLTHNTIATAAKANHLVISRVFLGGSGSVCPVFTGNSVTIISTGPDASTSVLIENNCHVVVANQTNVTVTNTSSSSTQSGSVSSSNNTGGGSATSGSVANSSSQSTTVIIGNGSSSSATSSQWFELHNPTSGSVNISGWMVRDNSDAKQNLPNVTIPAGGSVIIPASTLSGGQIGNGLSGGGDDLTLLNASGQTIDGLSWGSDTAVLNPAVAAIPIGGSAKRTNPDYDTDQASDWVVQGP